MADGYSSGDEGRRLVEDYGEPQPCGVVCDPRRSGHRFFVLIFMCLLSFGSYYCYDNPAALQDRIMDDLAIGYTEYTAIYSWYSWPNVVLCFFGGYLIDRVLGIRLGAIVFAALVFVGQLIFATGAYSNLLWLIYAGRFVFGIGGESLAVAQNTYAVKWFGGKELNMVFGLQLSISRAGSTLNLVTMSSVYQAVGKAFNVDGYQQLGASLFVAAVTCVFSLLCCLIVAYYDRRADRVLQRGGPQSSQPVSLLDVRTFPLGFWLICAICVFYYVAVFPFMGMALVFFERKFQLDHGSASACMSVLYILSAIASPFFGFVIDRVGRNIFFIGTAISITALAHGLFAFTFITPFLCIVMLGLSYSMLASSLWPLVSFCVPRHQLGTAYGMVQSIQNLGLGLANMAVGAILDQRGYLICSTFFISCLCVALMCTALMFIRDVATGGRLNASAATRRADAEAAEAEEKKPINASETVDA